MNSIASPPPNLPPQGGGIISIVSADFNLKALFIDVISDKTGYPAEMLHSEMALEADLGIDSIKRVEILAAVQERAPQLPEFSHGELAPLKTIGEIVAFLESQSPLAPVSSAPSVVAPSPTTISRAVPQEVPCPASGGSMLAGFSGLLAVTDDGQGVAAALVDALRQAGFEAALCSEVPPEASGVLFLGGLRDGEEARSVMLEAFEAARTVSKTVEEKGGLWISVQDTGGDFGLSGFSPGLGGLAALTRTAALEWPRCVTRSIDVQREGRSSEALAQVLMTELLSGGSEGTVGLHADGRRTTLGWREEKAQEGALPLAPGSVVVASGGGRGITAACLVALARQIQPRLALLGTTPLEEEPAGLSACQDSPSLKRALIRIAQAQGLSPVPLEVEARASRILAVREVRSNIALMEAAGATVRYLCVDVRDEQAVAEALRAVREAWGPIAGLVHGAGAVADKAIAEKTVPQFERVFDIKVKGLEALLQATAGDELGLIVLFSSVVSRMGNVGQVDYAMANESLNHRAHAEARLRGGACVVKSILWGPWDGGMVGPTLRGHFLKRGIALLSPEAGARAFLQELGTPGVEARWGAPLARSSRHPVQVNRATYPCIDDHRIQGKPVVPAVLALEWFVCSAKAHSPGSELLAVRDFKVLKGISLDHYEAAGESFSVQVDEQPGGRLALTLVGNTGMRHYSAVAEMGAAKEPVPFSAPEATRAFPWTARQAYASALFHGPSFQMLDQLKGWSDTEAEASLKDARELGWMEGAWTLDVPALDGALQLASLWGQMLLSRASLPTSIGAFVPHRPGLLGGPLRLVLQGTAPSRHRTLSTLRFLASDGTTVAELIDVEMHLLPFGPESGELKAQAMQAPPSLAPVLATESGFDGKAARHFWREKLGLGAWPMEELYEALWRRFVARVCVEDPAAFEALKGRGVLYLGNHQVAIESLLFSSLVSGMSRSTITVLSRIEHRDSWLGRLIALSTSYPGAVDPQQAVYFDRQDPASLPAILAGLKGEMARGDRSLLVHVEGRQALQCRRPVEKLSSLFLDLAVEGGLPIVSVRFSGGLPLSPLVEEANFPVGYGRQEYVLGRPILPETLGGLAYGERKAFVLSALNAVGPAWEQEVPCAPDAAFARAVSQYARPEPQAVLMALLSGELAAVVRGEVVSSLETEEGKWLQAFVCWLRGEFLPVS